MRFKKLVSLLLAVLIVTGTLAACNMDGMPVSGQPGVYTEKQKEKIHAELKELIQRYDFEAAAALMEKYPGFMITDKEIVEMIVKRVDERKLTYYWGHGVTLEQKSSAVTVMERIDCPDVPDTQRVMDELYLEYGFDRMEVDGEVGVALEYCGKCSENSLGNALCQADALLAQGDYVAAAKALDAYYDKKDQLRERGITYFGYLLDQYYPDGVQKAFVYALGDAAIENHKPCDAFSGLKTYEADPQTLNDIGDAWSQLEKVCGTAPAGKILVVATFMNPNDDTLTKGFDSVINASLPESYIPQDLAEVSYVVYIDYDYIKSPGNAKFTAGTIQITAYDVTTGEILHQTEVLEGTFKDFYYGPKVPTIFGTYPDLGKALVPVLTVIEHHMKGN